MFAICIALLLCLSIRIALHQWQILCCAFLSNCTHKPLAQMAVVCVQIEDKLMWLSRNRAMKTLSNHMFSSQHLLLHRNVCGMYSCLCQQLILDLNTFTRRPSFLTSFLWEEKNWVMPYHIWSFPTNLLWPCKSVTFAHETLLTLPFCWILKLFSCLFWTLSAGTELSHFHTTWGMRTFLRYFLSMAREKPPRCIGRKIISGNEDATTQMSQMESNSQQKPHTKHHKTDRFLQPHNGALILQMSIDGGWRTTICFLWTFIETFTSICE